MIRPLHDWIAMGIVTLIALSLGYGCQEAYPEDLHSLNSNSQLEIVLKTIAMEGANQSLEGQSLIACTLLNRALIRGTTPEVEALRRKQYSCWNDRQWAKTWLLRHYDSRTRARALKAYQDAIKWQGEPITHYHANDIKPYWAKGKTPALIVGDHMFYEGV